MHVERRAQVGALRGDVEEGARASGCEDEGRGASLGVGVGYGGADAPTGAEDTNGEVGGKVHGGGVDCRCGVIVLGVNEVEGVDGHGCWLIFCVVTIVKSTYFFDCEHAAQLGQVKSSYILPSTSLQPAVLKGGTRTGDRYSKDATGILHENPEQITTFHHHDSMIKNVHNGSV